MKLHFFLIFALLSVTSTRSLAQWQWVDQNGHKVFSDRAPPADIAEKNILKRPGGKATVAAATAPETTATAATPPSSAPALPKDAGVDKELAAKKKQAEDAEAAKHKAEDERNLKIKIENCARAKQAKTDFDSGLRIFRSNAKGEREVMDEASRVAEVKRIQGVIAIDCK